MVSKYKKPSLVDSQANACNKSAAHDDQSLIFGVQAYRVIIDALIFLTHLYVFQCPKISDRYVLHPTKIFLVEQRVRLTNMVCRPSPCRKANSLNNDALGNL